MNKCVICGKEPTQTVKVENEQMEFHTEYYCETHKVPYDTRFETLDTVQYYKTIQVESDGTPC